MRDEDEDEDDDDDDDYEDDDVDEEEGNHESSGTVFNSREVLGKVLWLTQWKYLC